MSEADDQISNRVIKASFPDVDLAILARVKVIAEANELPTDPKVLADDIQTVAVLALRDHENIDLLIQLMQQIGKVGEIQAIRSPEPTDRGRF